MLIQNHALDTRPVVIQVLHVVLQRLHTTFSMTIFSQDDKDERDQLQSVLCSVVQVITRGIGQEVTPFCNHIGKSEKTIHKFYLYIYNNKTFILYIIYFCTTDVQRESSEEMDLDL